MKLDLISRRSQSLRDPFCGVLSLPPSREQLGLGIVHPDGPDISKGFDKDSSHRNFSSEG